MATIQKGQILREDFNNWDGLTRTDTRIDATGGTITGNKIGDAVDILQVYGGGTNLNSATINDAMAIISSNNVAALFAPYTWTIDVDVTIPSNITTIIPAGCVFNISAGITLTINGPIFRQSDTYNSGLGTLTIANTDYGILGDDLNYTTLENGAKGFHLVKYPRTQFEVDAGVTPTAYEYEPGNIKRYGVTGDGTTVDYTALSNVIAVFDAAGGGVVELVPGETYNLGDNALSLNGFVSLNGNGATLYKPNATTDKMCIWTYPTLGTAYTINVGTNKYEASVTTTTASEAGNFAVDDIVWVKWGVDPYDATQPYACMVNKVAAVDAGTGVVTLASPIPYDWTVSTTSPTIQKLTGCWQGFVKNVTFKGVTGTSAGLYISNSFNAYVENIRGIDIGGAIVVISQSTGIDINGIRNESITNLGGSDKGRSYNAWSSQGLSVRGIKDRLTRVESPIFLESNCRGVMISDSHFIGTNASGQYAATIIGACEDIMITGNVFENFTQHIRYIESSQVHSTNNVFRNTGQQPQVGNVIEYVGNTFEYSSNLRRLRGLHTLSFSTTSIPAGATTSLTPLHISTAAANGVAVGMVWELSGAITAGTLGILFRNVTKGVNSSTTNFTGDGEKMFALSAETFSNLIIDAGDVIVLRVVASAGFTPDATLDLLADLLVAY